MKRLYSNAFVYGSSFGDWAKESYLEYMRKNENVMDLTRITAALVEGKDTNYGFYLVFFRRPSEWDEVYEEWRPEEYHIELFYNPINPNRGVIVEFRDEEERIFTDKHHAEVVYEALKEKLWNGSLLTIETLDADDITVIRKTLKSHSEMHEIIRKAKKRSTFFLAEELELETLEPAPEEQKKTAMLAYDVYWSLYRVWNGERKIKDINLKLSDKEALFFIKHMLTNIQREITEEPCVHVVKPVEYYHVDYFFYRDRVVVSTPAETKEFPYSKFPVSSANTSVIKEALLKTLFYEPFMKYERSISVEPSKRIELEELPKMEETRQDNFLER